MPALWQSSQRPMYVRTVWVGGFRHAILTQDDPYYTKNSRNKRPHSSATCSTNKSNRKRNTRRDSDNLEDCLRKFNIVIKNERETRRRPKSSQLDIETLDLSEIEPSEDEFVVKASQHPIYEYETSRSRVDSVYLSMRTLKSNRTARSDEQENTELSERVLQWLDLAGKVDLLAPENVERMNQPRHSWPVIQRKTQLVKSRTVVDIRKEPKIASPKVDSAKSQSPGNAIDRQNFYVPTSANTIENYALKSRNQNTPRQDANVKEKDKTKAKDLRNNILEARQKIASERSEMEKKYAELISKKLMPDLKGNKKQVHIFMPELPKKSLIPNSRTESLLSQLSQLSKVSKK